MKERTRLHEMFIAHLISESITTDLDTLIDAECINCYAAARMLTYPDSYKQYYMPGRIYNLMYGAGNFAQKYEKNPMLIHQYIMADSQALNQPCTKVCFNDIDPYDEYHYFGICKLRLLNSPKFDYIPEQILRKHEDWHFIFRLPTGIWLHKPGYKNPVELIEWDIYGKSFYSYCYNSYLKVELPIKITCFENFFYRLDKKYELSLPEEVLTDPEQSFY